MVFGTFFSIVSSGAMNISLSQVRSLSLIAHLFLMTLYVQGFTISFFRKVMRYVAFDLLWFIEDIYDEIFVLPDDEPYSQQADDVGYESRYLTINSGSITFFILLFFLQQLIFASLAKFAPQNSKVNKLAASQAQNLFAKFTNMFNEFYIVMAFITCINSSVMSMDNASKGFNTIYTGAMIVLLIGWPLVVTAKFALALRNLPKAASVFELAGLANVGSEMKEGGSKEE